MDTSAEYLVCRRGRSMLPDLGGWMGGGVVSIILGGYGEPENSL